MGWNVWCGSPDGITGLNTALNSGLTFDWMDPEPTTATPPIYQWAFGDISQDQGANVNMGSGSINFTPGFDVTRDITPRVLTESGDQTLSITVTPVEAADQLNVGVNVNEDSFLIPQITYASVDPDPGAKRFAGELSDVPPCPDRGGNPGLARPQNISLYHHPYRQIVGSTGPETQNMRVDCA